MTSLRLKAVYNTAEWRGPIRTEVLGRAGGRCEAIERHPVFGDEVRCGVRDRRYGGTTSLLIDHKDDLHPDPFDIENLQALCGRHSGKKDGGRRYS